METENDMIWPMFARLHQSGSIVFYWYNPLECSHNYISTDWHWFTRYSFGSTSEL